MKLFFLGLLLLLVGAYLALRTSPVQTWLAQQFTKGLSEDLGVRIEVKRVDLEWFRTVSLEGIYIEDLHRDTLLQADAIKGRVNVADLFEKKVHLSRLQLEGPHVELKKYRSDTALNHAFLIDHFSSTDTSGKGWELSTDAIGIRNGQFQFRNEHEDGGQEGSVNFDDLRLERIELEATGIHSQADSISARIKDLAFMDKRSGFTLDSLASRASFSNSGIRLGELYLGTPSSKLDGDWNFLYDERADMGEWVEKVRMDLNIEHSTLNSKDIAYFVEPLRGMEQGLDIEGRINGPIADIRAKKLLIQLTSSTYFHGDVELTGLPDISSTFMTIDAERMHARQKDLESIPLPPFHQDRTLSLPPQLDRLGDIAFQGRFTGFINDFVANGTLNSNPGQLNADLSFSKDTSNGHFRYDGNLRATDFDIGSYYKIDGMGRIDASLNVKGSGFGVERVNTQLNGSIARFEYANYAYRNLSLEGELADARFKGKAEGADPNFDFAFNGSIDLREEIPSYSFEMNIDQMRPSVLNLVDRDSSLFLSTQLKFEGKGADLRTLDGKLGAYQTVYREEGKRYELGDIELVADREGDKGSLKLISAPVLASIEGNFVLADLQARFSEQLQKVLPSLFGEHATDKKDLAEQDFEFDLKLMEHQKISKILFPEWEIASNSVLSGSFRSEEDRFHLQAFIPSIKYQGKQLTGLEIESHRHDDVLEFDAVTDTLNLTDSLYFEHFHLLGKALNNNLQVQTQWRGGKPKTKGRLESVLNFQASDRFSAEILASEFQIQNEKWELAPDGKILIDGEKISFEDLVFRDSTRSLRLDGTASADPNDELSAIFNDFQLGIIAPFVPDELAPRGTINGKAVASNLFGDLPLFRSDIEILETELAGHLLGDFKISSNWLSDDKKLSLKGSLQKEGRTTLKIDGFYFAQRDRSLGIDLETNGLSIQALNSFIDGGISGIEGNIKGPLNLRGSLDSPILTGEITGHDIQLTVDALNVTYGFDKQTITFYEEMIGFDYVPIHYIDPNSKEEVKERAHATGTLLHENFQSWNFNVFLEMDRLLAMNLEKQMNDLYYGTAYGSGTLEISGDPGTLTINVNARTEKGTDLKLPLGGEQDVQMESFVSFVDQDAPEEKSQVRDLEGIDMNFDLEMTPEAQVSIIFDEQIGDVMKGRGHGNIKMEVNTNGKFKMFGKYEIHQGDYLFTMQNVINKHFSIEKGGTIEWFGDPYEASLNLQAIYNLRTSLFPLMQGMEGDEAYKRRIPVQLVMNLSRDLMNPDISFDIRLPSLEQDVKTMAMSRIESMNKQAFSLLVLNRFINEQGQNTASNQGPNVGTNTSTELLSNQVSNWLSSISKEFDLGVNYRAGDEVTDEELAVALSTQLFNERVSLSGNFGVSSASEYSQNQGRSENNLVGDFTVQYDITKNGKFKLKVFNESNEDRVTQLNQADYTQGVGLYYQEEFDSAKELLSGLRRLFQSKEKEKEESEEEDSKDEPKKDEEEE